MNGTRNTALIFIILCLSYFQMLGQNYVPGEVLIKMKPGKSIAQKNNIKDQMNASTKKTFSRYSLELWQINTTQTNIEAIIQQYKSHPDIEYIEPNYIYEIEEVLPNDPSFDMQWGLHNTNTLQGDINAPAAWNITTKSPAIKVGIIDTGIDWHHEDLVNNIWQNLGEDLDGDGKVIEWNGSEWVFDPDDQDGEDSDENGYADDFIGWDFINNDNNPMDDNSHGTHVAGIIGAQGNNGIGVAGVTWDVQLVALKAFDGGGSSSALALQNAIKYAAEMQIPITNNSWSGEDPSDAIKEAIEMARDSGHLFIASAGNNGFNNDDYPRYPASYEAYDSNIDNIITVASIDRNRQLDESSNYGLGSVHIAAPGVEIYSTLPDNQYGEKTGTSMAAPFVAGACALVWGQYPDLTPTQQNTIGYKDIKQAIMNSAKEMEEDLFISKGSLDLEACMNSFSSPPPGCRVSDSLALVALYDDTNGDNWTNSWDLNTPITDWYGVTLTQDKCVKFLYLRDNNLIGTIPPEISYLTNLKRLYLDRNQLSGNIPTSLFDLTELQILFMGFNNLTGTIPPEAGNLPNVYFFHFAVNNLEGTIPKEIYKLPSLTKLHLSYNSFTGEIPLEIGDMAPQLKVLNLKNNNLSGTLPPGLGDLSNLTGLYLSNNPELADDCYRTNLSSLCGQLQVADVSNGTALPSWDDFCNNSPSITCSAYDGACRLTDSLLLLDIYNNISQTGWTPEPAWDIEQPLHQWPGVTLNDVGCVIELNLSEQNVNTNSNNNILPDITNLSELEVLNIYLNNIDEFIPPEIRSLSNLRIFDAKNSGLNQSLPAELGQLSNLEYLNLGANELTGTIPPELGNLSNLTSLYLNNNALEGYIPAQLGNLENLNVLILIDNQLSECYDVNLAGLCNVPMYIIGGAWDAFCNSNAEEEFASCGGTVWPGDMDSNGRVEKEDFLYWGAADGATGIPRSDMSTDWSEKVCADWETTTSGINNKHQDANGDGEVDDNDMLVIEQNYSQAHSFNLNSFTYANAQFFLEEEYQIDTVIFYTLSIISNGEYYGVACGVDIDTEGIINSVQFINQSNFESVSYFHDEQRILDLALTNNSETNNTSIPVDIGNLRVVIQEDILDGDFFIDLAGSGMLLGNQNIENPVNSTFYRNITNADAGVPRLYANVRHANCTFPTGEIYLRINDEYSYTQNYHIHWSDTEIPNNTHEITDLSPGIYTVTVTDTLTTRTNTMTVEVKGQYIAGHDESGNPIECEPRNVPPRERLEDTDENTYLQQNHPNPFSQTTTIPYDIPEDAKNPVLNIFDVTGNLKYTTPIIQTGEGEIQISQHRLPTGIYYYQLKMDERISATRKMIIVR